MGVESDAEGDEEPGRCTPCMRRQPHEPTSQEIREHNVNHTPYRSWCPACVAGRGKATPHHGKEQDEDADQDVHVDYWFMRDHKGAELIPITTIKAGKTKMIKAHIVPGKGDVDGAAARIVRDLEDMGMTGVVTLKSDQEPAILDLVKAVRRLRGEGTLVEAAKSRDSQSNGMIERGIQSIEGIVRTMKIALEKRLNRKINCTHPVMSWLIEHGAETLNRYTVGKDGRTPYERMKGKRYKGEMLEFGQKILHRYPGKSEGGSMQHRWEEGIWLGKRTLSDEHIVASPSGKIMKARSVQPKPLSESWDVEAILAVRATPWSPGGLEEKKTEKEEDVTVPETRTSEDDRTVVEMPEISAQAAVPDPQIREVIPRDFYLKEEYLRDKYGYTRDCAKCAGLQRKDPRMTRRAHTDACRDRVRKAMMADQKHQDRVQDAEERKKEYLARKVQEDEEATEGAKKARVVEVADSSTTSTSSSSGSGTQDRKRGRDHADDVEEQERPGGYQTIDQEENDDAAMKDVLQVLKHKARGGIDEDNEDILKMNKAMKAEERRSRGRYDFAEIFSPPRICKRARERGLEGGWSLDWMVKDPVTGQAWDLRLRHVQEKVMKMIRRDRPGVIVACPPCTLFSALQNLSGDPRVRCPDKWREAVELVSFAVEVCKEQARAGRKFVFEHPLTASSWALESLTNLMSMPGVEKVTTHMCAFGMKSQDLFGEDPVMKPTRFLTNSIAIRDKLNRRCEGAHRHVHLMSGRAAAAAVYPQALVDAIIDGYEVENFGKLYNIQQEMEKLDIDGLHEIEKVDWRFIDDTTGKELDAKLVRKARELELVTFREMGVYEYVPRGEARRSGGKLVGVRWVDVAKGDGVRSRLVAQEFAGKEEREDLFAGTPPLAAVKLLISEVATKVGAGRHEVKLMIADIKRAFLYGDIEDEIYVELPSEDPMKEQGYVGHLRKAMYGTRAAPQVWQNVVRATMEKLGFTSSRCCPGVYWNRARELQVVTHVDDFLCGGPEAGLDWLRRELAKAFELKAVKIGGGVNDKNEEKFLGRTIAWEEHGISFEGDGKHAEVLLEEWAMEDSKPVSSPGVAEEKTVEGDEQEKELPKEMATKFRRAAARMNYIALDRPDMSFTSKELSRSMSKPLEGDIIRMKRAIRYLRGHGRMKIFYEWQGEERGLTTYTDSDWAGCRRTRRSTSGGAILRGSHLITHWSSTQTTVALSSAEAELNAIVKGASETMGIMNLCKEMGDDVKGQIVTDSSAANGIAHRTGAGKVKHLEARQLWIQELVQRKVMTVSKIPRKINHSDVLTHHWLAVEGAVHFPELGLRPGKCGLQVRTSNPRGGVERSCVQLVLPLQTKLH